MIVVALKVAAPHQKGYRVLQKYSFTFEVHEKLATAQILEDKIQLALGLEGVHLPGTIYKCFSSSPTTGLNKPLRFVARKTLEAKLNVCE